MMPETERDCLDSEGKYLGSVVHHPRMVGYWMAMWKPTGHRDSGMKRYKTWRGAVNCVEAKIKYRDVTNCVDVSSRNP